MFPVTTRQATLLVTALVALAAPMVALGQTACEMPLTHPTLADDVPFAVLQPIKPVKEGCSK
ncbi:hypothetical protein ACMU_07900 [Actibacterium mucosum KCTC 23349]|uniref:Uncharacterized protein n=1 Tax=Actibacterium mucosum KCTC 23349 TaxID=1454373 RepID=A0A037ZMR5_9RHOB|nr:hypothetical protein [Actibacterium mucosum]KAJ56853.1 hypothetical protein ACMU_07900 [Actibacterium mucosum KCTC 23349]